MNKTLRNCGGVLMLLALLTTGFTAAARDGASSGANLTGANHTQKEITSFTANGYRGQVGGYTCCVMLPDKWVSGMKVNIEWKSASKNIHSFPGYADEKKYKEWEKSVKDDYVFHSAVVNIPRYDNDSCGLTVHFLPCNKVKATTSCWADGNKNNPIKEPLNMPEPKTCPR
ncbi:DUF3304 domain-containing protein [Obesumbacterium proteus]|uniref:Uncharacterized DUF3304 family protein n=1 Tax=Obesumbacterium proteus ATCC 12841 TaxID=1354268 RepID=A0AA91EDI4_9GAMM|nr:DUF3304 domain-containing protein [Obesumbacterium proteus]AMO82044.1 hypothetical protein DSM2777_14020 [Obesumbacterium proteus]OAT57288.1 uncharacterized DUF3304 family protein [Obesumbacterium proteus ATCC 12841]